METPASSKPVTQRPFFRSDPITSVVLLALVFIASQFIAAILVSLYPAIRSWSEAQGDIWIKTITGRLYSYSLLRILAIWMTIQVTKAAKVQLRRIGLIAPKLRDAGWALIAYGLYFLVYLVVVVGLSQFVPAVDLQQEQQIGFENAYLTRELVMAFLILVVLVPIAEEIMFRGFLFGSLRAKYAFWPAAIVTGVLFGAAHLQFESNAPLLWIAAIDTFILSCFLCYLREQLGSIWAPIGLHAIKNGVAFSILFAPRLFF